MSYRDDILDTTGLRLNGDFDRQVDQLLARVRLSRDEVEGLQDLFRDIEDAMRMCWRECRVYPFGSIVTGLGIKTSDVDCFVQLPPISRQEKIKPVFKVKNYLQRLPRLFEDVQAVPAAKVPIVKCYHLPRHRYCDINFKSQAGIRNSKLIAFLLHMDYRALPLAVIIKYWSKVHNLTGTNLMPNYTLTMMIIFYLQQVHILPPVCELQRNVEEFIVENWNTAFQENFQFDSKNRETLYVHLGGFFDFYKNFKFQEFIISPFLGKPIARNLFLETESLPAEYGLYKFLVRQNACEPMRVTSKICVQDPFEHDRNCGAAVFDKLAIKVIHFISESANKFEVVAKENFLEAILSPIPYQDLPSKKKNKNNTEKNNAGVVSNVVHNKYNNAAGAGRVGKKYRKKKLPFKEVLQKLSPYGHAIHTLYHKYQQKGNR